MMTFYINKNSDVSIRNTFNNFLKVEKLCQQITNSDEFIGDFADGWIVDNPKDSFEDRLDFLSAPFRSFIKKDSNSKGFDAFVFEASKGNYYVWFGSDFECLSDKISDSACRALAAAFKDASQWGQETIRQADGPKRKSAAGG
jgi:hypothetical protein